MESHAAIECDNVICFFFVWSRTLKEVFEMSGKSVIAKRSVTLVYVTILSDFQANGNSVS